MEYQLRQKEHNAALRKLHAAEHYILKVKASLSASEGSEASQQDKIEIRSPVTGSILRVIEKVQLPLSLAQKLWILPMWSVLKLWLTY